MRRLLSGGKWDDGRLPSGGSTMPAAGRLRWALAGVQLPAEQAALLAAAQRWRACPYGLAAARCNSKQTGAGQWGLSWIWSSPATDQKVQVDGQYRLHAYLTPERLASPNTFLSCSRGGGSATAC